jgi:hypothetical protein
MKFLDSTKPHRKSAGKPPPLFVTWRRGSKCGCALLGKQWKPTIIVPGTRFPVEVGGVVELNAAFLNESRTRGPV